MKNIFQNTYQNSKETIIFNKIPNTYNKTIHRKRLVKQIFQ